MTTGSIIQGSQTYPSTFYSSRIWSGSNGKSESVAGVLRTKWNAYDMTRLQIVVQNLGKPWGFPPLQWSNQPTLASRAAPLILRTQNKLVNKVRNHDFDAGAFLVEGKQTMSLITNNLQTIGRALVYNRYASSPSQVRKVLSVLGIKGRHTSYASDAAQRWLEFQYGWLPLIDDVYAAALAFEERTRVRRSQIYRVSSTEFDRVDVSGSPVSTICNGPGTAKYHVKLQYEFTEKLAVNRSLGLVNPVEAIWELLPYSFVIDWFLPISTYLDNLSTLPALEGRWCQTVSRHCVASSKLTPLGETIATGLSAYMDFVEVSRTAGSGFRALNIPLPRVKPLDKALSPLHIANAVALFHSLLNGKKLPNGFI